MPRPVQLVPRSEIPPSERDRYDLVVQRQRMHQGVADGEKLALGPYHAALASAPALGALISELGRTVRERGDVPGSYSHADREFADQVLAADARWDGFTMMHTLDGVSAGVRIEAMAAIRAGHEEDLTADERLLATYIRQVVSGTVQDET